MVEQKKDFFISYNQADRQWAEWIGWQLEQQHYTTIIQAWDFRPGSNFVLEMQRAAAGASRTIAVLSPEYLAAEYTQPEWAAAFAEDPTGVKRTLMPVLVRECTPEGMLAPIVYIDLVGATDESKAREILLSGVRLGRAEPTEAPRFPGRPNPTVPEKPRFPGALPSIWNVPHARNPNFTGREDLLTGLRQVLTSRQPAAVTQAISGLGGVGKTQLATEYVYRYGPEYDLVWWIPAEEPASLADTYAALAQELDLPEKDAAEQSVVMEGVKQWLMHNQSWLLVLDNAPDPEQVQYYLPGGATGHVLITSRYQAWGSVAQRLSVDRFRREESVVFLGRRTGQDDRSAADALAEALGDLPLALEQAGAYMEATGRPVAGYLELFRQHQRELLERRPPSPDYPDSVASTWEASFTQLPTAAADLMNLLAFLAPDNIPPDLIANGAEFLPPSLAEVVADPLKLDETIAALRQYSLIEVSDDTWSVHRLVQAVVRDRLTVEKRKRWVGVALTLLNNAFPENIEFDASVWSTCSRLLSHVMSVLEKTGTSNLVSTTTALLSRVAQYFRLRGDLTRAKAAIERAVVNGKALYGPDHEDVVADVNDLGLILHDLGDLAGALAQFDKALKSDESNYGSNHHRVAIRLNNRGRTLRAMGELSKAKVDFVKALAIEESGSEPDYNIIASMITNLAHVLSNLGDLAGAKTENERALAIIESIYGSDHHRTALFINNLGRNNLDLGDLDEANKHFLRALAIWERDYGLDHPSVAMVLINMGDALRALRDLAAAREHYQRALQILTDRLGPDHPNTVIARENLEALGPSP